MDSLLSGNLILFFIYSHQEKEQKEQKESFSYIWIKDVDMFKPSTHLQTLEKIPPGTYVVEKTRDYGICCFSINESSDELYVLPSNSVENLLNEIVTFWSKYSLYKEHKLVHKRGVLLEGPSGTGKSSIISLLCNSIIQKGGVVFKIEGVSNLLLYIDFIHTFRQIEPDTPIITIIEDIDTYMDYEAILLDFLDGKSQIDHHVVLATTNNSEELSEALLRPSRIDLRLQIPNPDEKVRSAYFTHKNVPATDLEDLVKNTKEMSMADLKEVYICKYLLDYSLENSVKKVKNKLKAENYKDKQFSIKKLGV